MASRTVLVTGGNRGIGFGIVQQIAQRSDDTTIIIASRKKEDAEGAIKELQTMGLASPFHAVALDVTNDESIQAAVAELSQKFDKLDVLINNAGIALLESSPTDFRAIWTFILNTNVVSIRILTELFLPLLRKSSDPRVINISSTRGSFDRIVSGRDPSVVSVPYSTSKACLNFMTLQMARQNPDIVFYAVSPGHCKTALNGFRGQRDPVDGGKAAAELAVAEKGKYVGGFWEDEGEGMVEVGW